MLKAFGLIGLASFIVIKVLNALMWWIASHSENCRIIAETALNAMCK